MSRALVRFSGLVFGASLLAGLAGATPAEAGNIATRCTSYGCEQIHCNDTGDRCYHVGGYYRSGYYRSAYYSTGDRYGNRYRQIGYRYGDDGDYGYDRGYGGHLICDSDGDRCYRSDERHWNYREYYRRHGYHWADNDYRYSGSDYRYTDRLNEEEYDRHRYDDRYDDRYDRGSYDNRYDEDDNSGFYYDRPWDR